MSALQSTIPFKPRKLRSMNTKSRIEQNLDGNESVNSTQLKRKLLKRPVVRDDDEDIEFNKESCSPTKISRLTDSGRCKAEPNRVLLKIGRDDEPPKSLTSRETEIAWLQNFFSEHLTSEESASIYISGPPGTGKTASLQYLLQLPEFREGYKQVYINCTVMKSAASIYTRICKELQLSTTGSSQKACLNAIETYLSKKHKMTLLVLDEVDQLDSKHQTVLYSIFEWPLLAGSRLLLVGVANALDLTERTLPRLHARAPLTPHSVHFPPYTKQQIIDIFTDKIAQEDKGNLFSPVALQMLAAKISAISGDMRRALDIGRRVIDIAKRNKFQQNRNIDNLMNDSSVTVELKQVLEVLNDVYGGTNKLQNNVNCAFPMHQKLILCSLMLILTKGKNKDVLLGKLYDVYKRVSHKRNIEPLDMSEVASACALLETHGAVRVLGTRGGGARVQGARGCGARVQGARGGGARVQGARARRVQLQWDQAELADALKDRALLSAILEDVHCLAP